MRVVGNLSWLVALFAVVLLAGCANTTAGQPTASAGSSAPSTEQSEQSDGSTASSGPKQEPDFSNTALCKMLTAEEAQSLGASDTPRPSYSTQDGHPVCTWSDETSLVIGFQKGGQYAPPTGPEITNTDITVAGHPAVLSKRVEAVRTNCQVLMQVSEDAVISTLAGLHDSGIGKFEECDLATRFANIVLPRVLEYY